MADEFDTLALAGTETVEPSETDTPDEWDYFDPDEDQEPEAITDDEGTEDEDGAPEDTPDEVEPEDEADDQPDETPKEAAEDAVVKLPDGTETTVGELTKGYFRQADYTRKSQEVAERRKAVEADASRMAQVTEALVTQLSELIPDAPDLSLAHTNPSQYTAQKAQHDAAMARLQQIMAVGEQAKEVTDTMSAQDRQRLIAEETAKLVSQFPQVGTQEGRQKFFEEAAGAAQQLGFSQDELGNVTDSRMFALAHYAKLGLEAEKAKQTAKAKVAAAPKATPRKPGQGVKQPNRNKEAMRRLAKSGSIQDALMVDFD